MVEEVEAAAEGDEVTTVNLRSVAKISLASAGVAVEVKYHSKRGDGAPRAEQVNVATEPTTTVCGEGGT